VAGLHFRNLNKRRRCRRDERKKMYSGEANPMPNLSVSAKLITILMLSIIGHQFIHGVKSKLARYAQKLGRTSLQRVSDYCLRSKLFIETFAHDKRCENCTAAILRAKDASAS